MIFLDLETLAWIQPGMDRSEIAQLPIGVVSTGVIPPHGTPHLLSWFPEDLPALYEYLRGEPSETIAGWNVAYFDLPILYHQFESLQLPPVTFQTFDLFAIIRSLTGRWYKLDVICRANLDRGKIGSGEEAVQWLTSGDVALREKAVRYCQDDVELCIELDKLLRSGQPLILPPVRRHVNELRLGMNPDGACSLIPQTPSRFITI